MIAKRSFYAPVWALMTTLALFFGCTRKDDIHDQPSTKASPCVQCHKSAFLAARQPKHDGVFPVTCGDCHSTSSWTPTVGDIHQSPAILATPCVDCHKAKYDATSTPKHAGTFPETCGDCHGTKVWQPLRRNIHETETAASKECVACHKANYDGAKNPAHVGLFPETCAGCHTTMAWKPATGVGHDWFPLNNKHAQTPCVSCHTAGYAKGATPKTCVGCHQKNYDATKNPPHASTGKGTDCKRCHDDSGWKFAHGWPLTGVHATAPCTGCHVGTPPVYAGTPKECQACHIADYNRSPFPGHQTFSKVCSDCHKTTGWKPAQGGAHPEAKFPLAGGKHDGFSCTDCHDPALGSPIMGKNANCIGCHTGQHRRTSMDAKHQGKSRNGVTYAAAAAVNTQNFCLSCHPMGQR
jgi:hypothetical protein